jgi:hypothetical protein
MKEDFCPACIAIPLAFTGAGTTAAALTNGGDDLKENFTLGRQSLLWIGLIILIASLIALFYIYRRRKMGYCRSCF